MNKHYCKYCNERLIYVDGSWAALSVHIRPEYGNAKECKFNTYGHESR